PPRAIVVDDSAHRVRGEPCVDFGDRRRASRAELLEQSSCGLRAFAGDRERLRRKRGVLRMRRWNAAHRDDVRGDAEQHRGSGMHVERIRGYERRQFFATERSDFRACGEEYLERMVVPVRTAALADRDLDGAGRGSAYAETEFVNSFHAAG